MTPHFINLNCTNCGAKPLDVHDDDDMERFACGYCGTEIIVQRRGGTVAPKALTAALIQVQTGPDQDTTRPVPGRHQKAITALGATPGGLPFLLTPRPPPNPPHPN